MSYLSDPTSGLNFGVVKVGDFINVNDGIISLSQDLSTTADVKFNSVSAEELFSNGELVITNIDINAGSGIEVSSPLSNGPAASFTVINTGVLSLTAGPGILINNDTGNIVISATGADLIAVKSITADYTATQHDEYIGVYSASAITVLLPLGTAGRVYTIKDEYGQGSGKITIRPQINEKIDNKSTFVINTPYQSVSLVFRGSSWWII